MLKTLLEGLFPVTCITCQKPGKWLCSVHQRAMPAPKNQVSYKYLDAIYVVTAYKDPTIKKSIERFKFKNARYLAKPLAQIISTSVPNDILTGLTLVPIPLHWRRQIWRGYNQSTLLVKALRQINPRITANTKVLKRCKATNQQARLSKSERSKNIKQAFSVKSTVPPKVMLIDDVVASGATLDEAARTLKNAGAIEVSAVVLARGG